jgi:hypothetical protein
LSTPGCEPDLISDLLFQAFIFNMIAPVQSFRLLV